MNKTIIHEYRANRRHQIETYGNSGLRYMGIDQRQFTGGGAAYGFHAIAAYLWAKSHIYFMKNIKKELNL